MGRFDETYSFSSDDAVPKLDAVRAAIDEKSEASNISWNQMFELGVPEGTPRKVEREIESYWLGNDCICLTHHLGKGMMLLEFSGSLELFEKVNGILTSMGGKPEHGCDYWRQQESGRKSAESLQFIKVIAIVASAAGVCLGAGYIFGWGGILAAGMVLALLAFIYVVMLAKSFRR